MAMARQESDTLHWLGRVFGFGFSVCCCIPKRVLPEIPTTAEHTDYLCR